MSLVGNAPITFQGGLPYARGAAMVLNFNCMLVLLSMCRNIISFIRSNLIVSIFLIINSYY